MKYLARPLVAAFCTYTFAAGQTPPALAQAGADLDARIARIETGLRFPVAIRGRPPVRMRLDQRMLAHKVPGVSVAVIDSFRIAWARGYGVREVGGTDTVTTETLFQAASISKPIAALAALRFVQEGTLDLDEDVNGKLKSWKIPENRFTATQPVTLRRILSHSAGLTVHGFRGYAATERAPTLLWVAPSPRSCARVSSSRSGWRTARTSSRSRVTC